MDNDKVIIDYDRHQQLLKAEENWLKYKEEHMYAGAVVAVVRSARGVMDDIRIDVRRKFTPNTPEEVKEELIKQADRLSEKIETFHKELEERQTTFEEYTKMKYKNIPMWIQKLFI